MVNLKAAETFSVLKVPIIFTKNSAITTQKKGFTK
jgi:hypothetical protein